MDAILWKKGFFELAENYFLFRRTTITINGMTHGTIASPMQTTPNMGEIVPVVLLPVRPVVV